MQKQEMEELKNLIKPEQSEETKEQFEKRISLMTEAEISEEFLNNYKKLCMKYKRDFMQAPPEIIKLDIK